LWTLLVESTVFDASTRSIKIKMIRNNWLGGCTQDLKTFGNDYVFQGCQGRAPVRS
jgi:hypothetical protein